MTWRGKVLGGGGEVGESKGLEKQLWDRHGKAGREDGREMILTT